MKRLLYLISLSLSLFLIWAIVRPSAPADAGTVNKSTSQGTLASGLVGHWTFDGADVTSVTTTDKSGNGNNGTRQNGVLTGRGKIGQGMKFDGVNDSVKISNLSTGDVVSYGGWFKVTPTSTAVPNMDLLDNATSGELNTGIELYFNGSQNYPTCRFDDGATQKDAADTSRNLRDNRWHHIFCTKDANDNKYIYIDGVLAGSNTEAIGSVASADNFYISTYDGSTLSLSGSMDDVRVYNRVLSPTEIVELYKMGGGKVNKTDLTRAQLRSGLVGHWTFDGADVTSVTTTDKSGSGNNGTRQNGVLTGRGKIGQAMNFTSSTNNVVLGSDILGVGADSVCVWLYPKSYGGGGSGRIFDNSGARMYYIASGISFVGSGSNITNSASLSPAFNRWYHTCVTRNASGAANFYINGLPSGTANQVSGEPAAGAQALVIGNNISSGGTSGFDGYMDDMRFYSRVLSPTEIVELYKMGGGKVNKTDLVRAQLRSGLVGHYTFDGADVTANTTTDKSGNGNNGTRQNDVLTGNGKIGQGMKFDGVNDSVKVSNLSTGDVVSYGGWFKVTPTSTAVPLIDLLDNAVVETLNTGIELFFNSSQNYPTCRFDDGVVQKDAVDTSRNLRDNRWHHIFCAKDANDNKYIYIDGVLAGSNTEAIGSVASADNFYISTYDGSTQPFSGSMDDVRVYNRVLSATEIKQLYYMGR